jgi:hypothetical protein
MRQRIRMHYVPQQAALKLLGIAVFQANSIVISCVVHKAVKTAVLRGNVIHGATAFTRFRQFGNQQFAWQSGGSHLRNKLTHTC